MNESGLPMVLGKDGLRGRLETEHSNLNAEASSVAIRLEDGREIYVGQKMLHAEADGSYSLPYSLAELEQADRDIVSTEAGNVTVPIVAEELQVGTRTVETGRVLIHKTVQEQEETVDPALLRRDVVVERVPINRLWEGPAPEVRHEGDVMIIPVLEEVLVVEKRLYLIEEVHIRQEQTTYHAPQSVTVRREEVHVERVALPDASATSEPAPRE